MEECRKKETLRHVQREVSCCCLLWLGGMLAGVCPIRLATRSVMLLSPVAGMGGMLAGVCPIRLATRSVMLLSPVAGMGGMLAGVCPIRLATRSRLPAIRSFV